MLKLAIVLEGLFIWFMSQLIKPKSIFDLSQKSLFTDSIYLYSKLSLMNWHELWIPIFKLPIPGIFMSVYDNS